MQTNENAQFAKASELYRQGKTKKAESLCRQIVEGDPGHADALVMLGILAAKRQQMEQADGFFRQALSARPDSVEINYNCGRIASELRDYDEAVRRYEKCIELNPGYLAAWNSLGSIHVKRGDYKAAIACFKHLSSLVPDSDLVYHNMGEVYALMDRTSTAIDCFRKAVGINPKNIGSLNSLAVQLHREGRSDEAMDCLKSAERLNAGDPLTLTNLASIATDLEDFDLAAAYLHRLLDINGDNAQAHASLGFALISTGQYEKAIEHYQTAVHLSPDTADHHHDLGRAFVRAGRYEEALAEYERAITLNPESSQYHNDMGAMLMIIGDKARAESCYREALRLDPGNEWAHYNLSKVKRYTPDDRDAERIEELLAHDGIEPERQPPMYFALGKAYEDAGAYGRAFSNYEKANRLMRATFSYSIEDDREKVARIISGFDQSLRDRLSNPDGGGGELISVLGMMRSGTSLIEQIIGSHPAAFGGGELEFFNDAVKRVFGDLSYSWLSEPKAHIDREKVAQIADLYLEQIERIKSESDDMVIDKMPINFFHIGLILSAFPDAKIIHCKRDPIDTCLSCYKQCFAGNHPFTFKLEELADYYELYRELMDHWDSLFPGKIHHVVYEDVVAHQTESTRRVLEDCGLPWDDSCLAFHETERPVATASAMQVKRPMYSSSVRRWRAYEAYLEPLMKLREG